MILDWFYNYYHADMYQQFAPIGNKTTTTTKQNNNNNNNSVTVWFGIYDTQSEDSERLKRMLLLIGHHKPAQSALLKSAIFLTFTYTLLKSKI